MVHAFETRGVGEKVKKKAKPMARARDSFDD
jgi:hypothetical protein